MLLIKDYNMLYNLPIPAAFREAMIALRSIIKDKNNDSIDSKDDYNLLYRLGVINSMAMPYSEFLKQPGFNVLERIPGGMLFNLDIPYKKIGYNQIELFNKIDCKNFVNLWGEPESHQTMNTYYNNIWIKYERITKDDQAKHRLELHKIIDNMK